MDIRLLERRRQILIHIKKPVVMDYLDLELGRKRALGKCSTKARHESQRYRTLV